MPSNERSVLRVREAKHIHPDRQRETIVEVIRNGSVVATIYGSREGIQIVSERLESDDANVPFRLSAGTLMPLPAVVLPLLAVGEPCPWCADTDELVARLPICPVCRKLVMRQ